MNKKHILIILIFICLSLLLSTNIKAANISMHDLSYVEATINNKDTIYTYGKNANKYEMKLCNIDFKYGTNGYTGDNSFVKDSKEEFTKVTEYNEENNKLVIKLLYQVKITNNSSNKLVVDFIKYTCDENINKVIIDGTVVSGTGTGMKTYKKTCNTSISAESSKIFNVVLQMDANNGIKRQTYKTNVMAEVTEIPEDEEEESTTYQINGNEIEFRLAQSPDTRNISGNVWDDSSKDENGVYKFADGVKNDDEEAIEGIRVQLIEVKDDSYYIWQEVRTDENGEYYFNNILPGDYIVRFIYGNGISEIIRKYNGYDYKSTTDLNYSEDNIQENNRWYNEYYNEIENASVARDNEARRLDVTAETASIDSYKGNILKGKSNIQTYYMYADTHKINIGVGMTADVAESNSNSLFIDTSQGLFNFENVNFGLEERPKSYIELEKHITALNVTTNAGTTIIDAKMENADSSGNINFNSSSIINGLNAILSTREKMGNWTLTTDIEEIIQGAKLYLEYTYSVKNIGETDYISKTLEEEFEKNASKDKIEEYSKYLKSKAKEIRGDLYSTKWGIYLGSTYYTGIDTADDVTKIKINVGKIEDYIDNSLKFVEVNSSDFKVLKTISNSETGGYSKSGTGKDININAVVQSKDEVGLLLPEDIHTKTILLDSNGLLSSTGNLEFISYVAQISTACTSPNGRRYYKTEGEEEKTEIPGNTKIILENDYLNGKKALQAEKDSASAEIVKIINP